MELKIGTINLNGNSFRFAFQPKIPNRAYDRDAIKNNMFMILMEGIEKILTHYDIIAVPQRVMKLKQICLGNVLCGISVIHFALYDNRPPIPRYHIVSGLITKSSDL